jgi:hypothetical protein
MTTQTEHAEMVEEVRGYLGRGNHPWPPFVKACQRGDLGAAQTVIEVGRDRLSPREKISTHYMLKKYFPGATEREETGSFHDEVAQSLARRQAGRRERHARKLEHSKPNIGWNVPPEDGVEYGRPSGAGASRNAPTSAGQPQNRGFDRIRQMYNRAPEGGADG